MNAAAALGLNRRAQIIGVMTALGESSLRVIDYGDSAGPDSRGLFQQRANGAWGSYADRMDPRTSATNFFNALVRVAGWETLPATIAAHRTQRNADPFHYERFEAPAAAIVAALSGNSSTPNPGAAEGCAAPSGGSVTAEGWTRPAGDAISSWFGMRYNPGQINHGEYRLHAGIDFDGACGAAIYAAADGVVVRTAFGAVSGWEIVVDHGGGVTTSYKHMEAGGILVSVSTRVSAGQLIARQGETGNVSGCHLHFEVREAGQAVDPAPFLRARGVVL
jgi:murein DD-endopeptidase MepM/ murein hydrolase activator NlpD